MEKQREIEQKRRADTAQLLEFVQWVANEPKFMHQIDMRDAAREFLTGRDWKSFVDDDEGHIEERWRKSRA